MTLACTKTISIMMASLWYSVINIQCHQ